MGGIRRCLLGNTIQRAMKKARGYRRGMKNFFVQIFWVYQFGNRNDLRGWILDCEGPALPKTPPTPSPA